MKKLSTKILFISLLLSAAIPSGAQEGWFASAKKSLSETLSNQTDFLKRMAGSSPKIINVIYRFCKIGSVTMTIQGLKKLVQKLQILPQSVWNVRRSFIIYITAMMLTNTVLVATHEWGHKTVLNYFYPHSAKIVKISPFGGGTIFRPRKLDCHGENNHLKVAAGIAAGSIIGFSSSYSLQKLLKYYTVSRTNLSFLSSLLSSAENFSASEITNLVNTNFGSDAKLWKILAGGNKDASKILATRPTFEWYHNFASSLIRAIAINYFCPVVTQRGQNSD